MPSRVGVVRKWKAVGTARCQFGQRWALQPSSSKKKKEKKKKRKNK